jgi:hypothetical protein
MYYPQTRMLPNRLGLIECTSKVALFDIGATSSKILPRVNKRTNKGGESVGSSPSGFTTHETKVHVVCESELDNWRSRLGCLGTILAEPAKFIPRYFVEKPFLFEKTSSNWVYKKLLFFDFK